MNGKPVKHRTASACLLSCTLVMAGCAWFPESTQRAKFPKRLNLPAGLPLSLLAHRPDIATARLHAEEIKVADALTRRQEAEARLTEQQGSLGPAQSNESLAQTLKRAGLINRSDLLEARIQVLDQRYHLATLENERIKTAVQLFKALGGYTENDKL